MAKPTLTERVSQHDREIAAIRKLVLTGMKMIVDLQKGMKDLQGAQKRTEQGLQRLEQTVERFVRSLEGGSGNGHKKGPIQ
jgi:hypothetical protein